MPTFNRRWSCADLKDDVKAGQSRLNMDQVALAYHCGVAIGTIHAILQGRADRGVNYKTAIKLGRALGFDPFKIPTAPYQYAKVNPNPPRKRRPPPGAYPPMMSENYIG